MNEKCTKIEIWANVKGFEGVLMVSNTGRFKVLEKKFRKGRGNSFNLGGHHKEYIKKPLLRANGYYCYQFKLKKLITFAVNKLVATHFVINPDPENYRLIGHFDGNKYNCNAFNLYWTNKRKRETPDLIESGRLV